MSETFIPPATAVAQYEENKKKRDEEYNEKNRLKEGTYGGRILKIGEEMSRNNNSMFVMGLRINKANDGKAKDEKKVFVKSLDFQMKEFYDVIADAGFDLKAIKSEDILGDILNKFAEELPECEIVCSHQKGDTGYNNYVVRNVKKIGLDFFGKIKEQVKEETVITKEGVEPKVASADVYTEEDIMEFDKNDCLEAAEELGITLVSKLKGKMQKELIAHIKSNSKPVVKIVEAPADVPEEEEEEELNIFPDMD